MKLVWARYGTHVNGKYDLYMVLGDHDGKVVCIKASMIPDEIAAIIKSRDRMVDNMPLVKKVDWLRGVWPAYGVAYREIHAVNFNVDKTYEV